MTLLSWGFRSTLVLIYIWSMRRHLHSVYVHNSLEACDVSHTCQDSKVGGKSDILKISIRYQILVNSLLMTNRCCENDRRHSDFDTRLLPGHPRLPYCPVLPTWRIVSRQEGDKHSISTRRYKPTMFWIACKKLAAIFRVGCPEKRQGHGLAQNLDRAIRLPSTVWSASFRRMTCYGIMK